MHMIHPLLYELLCNGIIFTLHTNNKMSVTQYRSVRFIRVIEELPIINSKGREEYN